MTAAGAANSETVTVPRALVLFLLGEGPWQGRDFGDLAPVGAHGFVKRYWWREDLRAALAAAPSQPPPVQGGEAAAWRVDWVGRVGCTGKQVFSLHDTEQEAVDAAEWISGTITPLFAAPSPAPVGRDDLAKIISGGAPFPSKRSFQKADSILALFAGRAGS